MTFEDVQERLLDETVELMTESQKYDKTSPEYKSVMEQVRLNTDRLNEIYKANNEAARAYEAQEIDKGSKAMDVNEKRKDRWVNVGIAVGSLILTETVRVLLFKAGFQFEIDNSPTSTFFRSLINSLTRKS